MQLICAGDAELNRIVIKGLKDYALLGETEKPQFIETFMAFVSFSQNAFYQWQEKALVKLFSSAPSFKPGRI